MTVGISAICRRNGNPHAIVAADRMVTVGNSGGIEYEDTESKLHYVAQNDQVAAVAVGSGTSTYIDEVFSEVDALLSQDENATPETVQMIENYVLTAYKNRSRETIQNQILSPYGYTLADFRDPDVQIPHAVQQDIINEINDLKEQLRKKVQILVGAVDSNGDARIFQVLGNDTTDYSDIGYSVIGSGGESANLTFIRRDYDRTCSYDEGVFTVLEAKQQAEERQGVGRRTDMVMIGPDGITEFSTEELGHLEDDLETIDEREQEVRENVISDWSIGQ